MSVRLGIYLVLISLTGLLGGCDFREACQKRHYLSRPETDACELGGTYAEQTGELPLAERKCEKTFGPETLQKKGFKAGSLANRCATPGDFAFDDIGPFDLKIDYERTLYKKATARVARCESICKLAACLYLQEEKKRPENSCR